MPERKVSRVLVMLDYGSGDPDSGEVFDLTALAQEMQEGRYSADVNIKVKAEKTYAGPDKPAVKMSVSFGGYAGGEFVYGATHLDDVVNSALPDGERVATLKKKAKRLRKQAEDVDRDAMVAKLTQVAGVRHQNPIARVTEGPDLLEAAS
jgi:hypothetical protein